MFGLPTLAEEDDVEEEYDDLPPPPPSQPPPPPPPRSSTLLAPSRAPPPPRQIGTDFTPPPPASSSAYGSPYSPPTSDGRDHETAILGPRTPGYAKPPPPKPTLPGGPSSTSSTLPPTSTQLQQRTAPPAPPAPPPRRPDRHADDDYLDVPGTSTSGKGARSRTITSFVASAGGDSTPSKTRRYDPSHLAAAPRSSPGSARGFSPSGRPSPAGRGRDGASTKADSNDNKIQQLRGIFGAFDENRDGILTKEELSNALRGLGIRPTPQLIQKYLIGSSSGQIDLKTFVNVSLSRLEGAETTMGQILELFDQFDEAGTGIVPSQILRHLLHGVDTESALSKSEADDLLKMTGIFNDDAYLGLGVDVDYREFIQRMMF